MKFVRAFVVALLLVISSPIANTTIAGHVGGSGAYCTCGYPGCVLDYCECGGPGCDNGRTANPKTKTGPKAGTVDFGSGMMLTLFTLLVIARLRT